MDTTDAVLLIIGLLAMLALIACLERYVDNNEYQISEQYEPGMETSESKSGEPPL